MRLDLFRQSVLALMLVDTRFLTVASVILHPRYFEDPVEQHLARIILEHFREYKELPKRVAILNRAHRYFKKSKNSEVTEDEFTEFVTDIFELCESASEQANYLSDEVGRFCREQSLKEAIIASVDEIQKGDLSNVLHRVESALAVGSELQGKGIFLFGDAKDTDVTEEIRECIPTGYDFIDKPTRGGLARREFGLIMAPPNVGKTTALVNIGSGIARNRFKVAHVTLEMHEKPMKAMYQQCFLNKSRDQLLSLNSEQQILVGKWLFKQKANLKADINIKHFSAHRLSVEGLHSHLLMLRSMHGFYPDAILLDYMDLMMMPTHIKDEVGQLTWVGEELRSMAEEENIAMWSATQTNRGGVNKQTVNMSDVAGDFKKMATADVVISLNQNEKEQQEDIMRWFYVKNRAGKKHQTFTTVTNFERSRIEPA